MSEMTKTENTGVELVPVAKLNQLREMEDVRRSAAAQIAECEKNGEEVMKGMVIASAMQRLRQALTDEVMQDVVALMNSPLGFKTDKDPAKPSFNRKTKQYETPVPYPVPVVRDCVITALLSGFRITGNEFNIISGQCYGTKEGYKALIDNWPGLKELDIELGVPAVSDGGALVPAKATWVIEGGEVYEMDFTAAGDVDTRIPVRLNSGMGVDAALGKARRKIYARIVERLTGVPQGSGETTVNESAGAITQEETDYSELREQAQRLAAAAIEVLPDCDDLTAAKQLYESNEPTIRALGLPDEDADAVLVWLESAIDARCNEIRATRGGRANESKQEAQDAV